MRILQIYELSPLESVGGVEIAILQLSEELVKLGHEVTILTGAGRKNGVATYNGLRIINFDFLGSMKHTYSPGRLNLLRQFLFLSSIVAKPPVEGYDIYHGHIYSSGIAAKYLAKKNQAISVNTIHGSYYPVWNKLTNPISAAFYKNAEKKLVNLLARHADLQIHVSTYFAKEVSYWNELTRIIPNGVDNHRFNEKVEACLSSQVPVILTGRRLVKKNGVEYLIKAVRELSNECRLIIIGDGPERRRLEGMARGSENIEFLGEVAHNDMPAYIAGADIVVVPSIVEASSLFMLEAMAMAKPVVASAVGGLPEIIGDAGVLVPPMDPENLSEAIRLLLHDPKMRRRLGGLAQKRVRENYTWEKIAKRIDKEYKRLESEKNA